MLYLCYGSNGARRLAAIGDLKQSRVQVWVELFVQGVVPLHTILLQDLNTVGNGQ